VVAGQPGRNAALPNLRGTGRISTIGPVWAGAKASQGRNVGADRGENLYRGLTKARPTPLLGAEASAKDAREIG